MTILPTLGFLIPVAVVEGSADAIIRIALHNHSGANPVRVVLFVLGAALVFAYATSLNLAPLEFGEVVGLYIATLFVICQIMNVAFFRTLPTARVLIGGALVVVGGAVISFWKV